MEDEFDKLQQMIDEDMRRIYSEVTIDHAMNPRNVGSLTTELATGRKWPEALEISQADVLEALGGLPEEDKHCALLAATTLKLAISDLLSRRKEPWKKDYDRR